MKTITFPTRIEKVAAKDTTRYAIQQILVVNPEGADAYAVATDGKCLAVADCDASALDPGRYTVEARHLPTAKKNRAMMIHGENGDMRTTSAKNATDVEEVGNGKGFPPYADVLPDADTLAGIDSGAVRVSATLLRKLLDAVINPYGVGGDQHDTVWLLPNAKNSNRPLVVMGNAGLGVLMPVGGSGAPDPLKTYAGRVASCCAASGSSSATSSASELQPAFVA